MSTLTLQGLPDWARQQLEDCSNKVETLNAARSLWSRLNQQEQQRIGMGPIDAWQELGTVEMWLRARQFDAPNDRTRAIATLKVGEMLHFIWPQNVADICRALGNE
ncbi:MAG: hypothetical protein MI757_17925 [Pirellulales bacterium]|nr:hypothetical protein [Pirellulales bacterium]